MKKQRGRPKLDNPKSVRVSVRCTEQDQDFIKQNFETMQNFFDTTLKKEKGND